MAKPKLALVPSTIGTKVYSVLPSNGDGDFTFTRATKATRINSLGLIEEVLDGRNRLNYSLLDREVQECPHLLLEPARTNSITYSENFSQWSLGGGLTRTENSIISPDGTLNAYKIEKTSQNYCYLRTTFAVGSKSVMSVFVKKGNYRYIGIRNNADSHNVFDFDTKSFVNIQSNHNVSFVEYPNDWFRLIDVRTISSNTSAFRGVALTKADGAELSNDIPLNAFNYVWGAQLEVGDFSYPTSYIKTTGSVVTRNAEVANGAGSASTFNNTKGVLMTEMASLVNTNSAYNSFSIGAGSTNVMSVGFTNALDTLYVYKTNGSSAWLGQMPIVDIAKFNKVALRYNGSNNEFWINGFKLATNNTIGAHASAMSDMDFNAAFGGEPMYSKTKQVQYFDSELTESQLEELTSWVSFREMANGQGYIIE